MPHTPGPLLSAKPLKKSWQKNFSIKNHLPLPPCIAIQLEVPVLYTYNDRQPLFIFIKIYKTPFFLYKKPHAPIFLQNQNINFNLG